MRTIIEMVNHTRLDCVLGSPGDARRRSAQALAPRPHRSAFGAPLDRRSR